MVVTFRKASFSFSLNLTGRDFTGIYSLKKLSWKRSNKHPRWFFVCARERKGVSHLAGAGFGFLMVMKIAAFPWWEEGEAEERGYKQG